MRRIADMPTAAITVATIARQKTVIAAPVMII